MKRLIEKRKKLVKGTPVAVLLSILIHAALFLLAGVLIVFTVITKEEKIFEPPRVAERPKMKLRKPKVQIKKSAKPKSTMRIVSKSKSSMPNIELPEMSGMGNDLGGGIGGFDLMPDLDTVSFMGSGQSIGNDFEGTLYDFKRRQDGGLIPYGADEYRDAVRRFMKGNWKPALLSRYYRSPKNLYATCFVIPPVLSEVAPAAFGEDQMEGNFWMAHYQGQLVHEEGITFRFIGSGDEILAVRVNGEVVFASAWWYDESPIIGDIWNSSAADSKKYWMGNQPATVGDWITLEPCVPLPMEVILTDNGGQACLMLAIEEQGVEYERTPVGGPIFPIFKTTELSHDLLDVIMKDLVAGEVNLTNGPVFSDYSMTQKPTPDIRPENASTTSKVPAAPTVPESSMRQWASNDGKVTEAEYVTLVSDNVLLRNTSGKQHKVPLSQLTPEDRLYVELENPPQLEIAFSRQNSPKFSIVNGGPSGNTVAYINTYSAKMKQTNPGEYKHELHAEFFAIGKEIHGTRFVLLDRQKSSFMLTNDNNRSHNFTGNPVEVPNFTLEGIHRGIDDSGYLVVVTDARGKIIKHSASKNWLLENLENLRRIPVGSYMDKTGTRVYPTGPKRTRY